MENSKYNYTGMGICFGSGISTIAAVLAYVFTKNPVYFAILGLGPALGLIIGSILDNQKKNKN